MREGFLTAMVRVPLCGDDLERQILPDRSAVELLARSQDASTIFRRADLSQGVATKGVAVVAQWEEALDVARDWNAG